MRVVVTVVVEFEALVTRRALVNQDVLGTTAPAIGVIHGVIVVAGQNDVAQINRTTEHFNTVIGVVVDLDEVDVRAGTHTLECDTVQLVARVQTEASETNLNVAQLTGAIGRLIATEQAGRAFTRFRTIGRATNSSTRTGVDRSETVDHQAAPLTFVIRTGAAFNVRAGGEDDRVGRRTDSVQLVAASDNQVVTTGRTEQRHTFIDGQVDRRAAIRTDESRAGNDDTSACGDFGVGRDRASDFAGIDRDVIVHDACFTDRTRAATAGRDHVDGRGGTATATTAATRRRTDVQTTRRGDGRIRTSCEKGAGRADQEQAAEVLLHRH